MKIEKIHNLEWISKNQVDLKEEQKILNNHNLYQHWELYSLHLLLYVYVGLLNYWVWWMPQEI